LIPIWHAAIIAVVAIFVGSVATVAGSYYLEGRRLRRQWQADRNAYLGWACSNSWRSR
jgi:membrane protein YqaA with SNARE-associated domain